MTKRDFDPATYKARLLGDTGYEWCLEDDFADANAVGGVASTADANLATAIECLLVGFDKPAERLLKKALKWVQAAIESDERPKIYAPFYLEASRFFTRALCNWLLFDRQDDESFQLGIEFLDRYFAEPKIGRDARLVSLVLPMYPAAGAYARALEVFAATPKLSPPTSTRIQGEARMSYVVSRHRLGLQYSAAELAAMATQFFGRNVDVWLTDGLWVRAAEWMKIIHWNGADPPISAKEALLKCYDYLPGREPPTGTGT